MEYYRLILSDSVKGSIPLTALDPASYKVNLSKKEFEQLPEGIVTFYKYHSGIEMTDILMSPTMLVSPQLKKVLQMYNKEIEAKSVKVFPVQKEINLSPEYWVLHIPELDCLNREAVKINPNGTVQELILNRNDIGEADVFKVKGTLENFVIVSLAVVESILRRKMYGVGFREVKVK